MHHRGTAFRAAITAAALALAALSVAACGSSNGTSGDPATLLSQTFSGSHKVDSGKLNLSLTLDPSGSTVLSGPITLTFGGPFQTRGAGKLPASDFTVSASALGRSVSLGIISTGTNGYVTLQGASYQMPQATFQRLESGFAQLSAASGGKSGSSLSKLGIHPLQWLTSPSIVGTENVGGAPTTHIHAGVNLPAMLSQVSDALVRLGLKTGLPATTRQKIASEVKNPSVDVWTGTSDHTIRRLTILLTLTGKAASAIGGAQSATLSLTLQYSDLNQPQTIIAPTSVRPYSEFQSKVRAFLQEIQGVVPGLGGSSLGNTLGGGSSGGAPSSGSSSSVTKYSQCIQQAAGDVAKMQKCASLLSSGG